MKSFVRCLKIILFLVFMVSAVNAEAGYDKCQIKNMHLLAKKMIDEMFQEVKTLHVWQQKSVTYATDYRGAYTHKKELDLQVDKLFEELSKVSGIHFHRAKKKATSEIGILFAKDWKKDLILASPKLLKSGIYGSSMNKEKFIASLKGAKKYELMMFDGRNSAIRRVIHLSDYLPYNVRGMCSLQYMVANSAFMSKKHIDFITACGQANHLTRIDQVFIKAIYSKDMKPFVGRKFSEPEMRDAKKILENHMVIYAMKAGFIDFFLVNNGQECSDE